MLNDDASVPEHLPLLPLRDLVVYPHMVVPLFVGRDRSIAAVDAAIDQQCNLVLVAQKDPTSEDPLPQELFKVGTEANILQVLKLPDGTVKVLVEGLHRFKIKSFQTKEQYFTVEGDAISPYVEEPESTLLMRSVLMQFEQYAKLNPKVPSEILANLSAIDAADRFCDSICAHLMLKVADRQKLLEVVSVSECLKTILGMLDSEIEVLQVDEKIRKRVHRQMARNQKEYYLNAQMQAIQTELGEITQMPSDHERYEKAIEASGMSEEAREKALTELVKLRHMPPVSAESTVTRNYLDTLLAVPWKKRTRIRHDLARAERLLDKAHFGLEEVKKRILEYLAVLMRLHESGQGMKGSILCLVGPPGVGKTSLGESVAEAMGRKFVRVALGGVRDEAEIRGHRRTYIGALPGKIIQKISKVGVRNPLFLLDEVDKMASDFRGDPASALLEVLDPEQNNTFNDHYLEVDYDLSEVMFIATANTLDIPGPLLDRMEVIRIPGYTEHEKVRIAMDHLVPKQVKQHGLKPKEIKITMETVQHIIRYYTREAGVRSLERTIAKLCRKVVRELVSGETKNKTHLVTPETIEHYLGVRKHRYGKAEERDQIGQVTGLAWTEVGGELLTIEAAVIPGKGGTTFTGHLGDVMKESIQAAMTVVRSRARTIGIPANFYQENDVHLHVPEGATPKDGPSAGVAMCTALVSVLTQIPVRADVAMTGEITLRGEVLPIGGLKEKLLAAQRGGIKTVLIPHENSHELQEVPDNIKEGLTIHPVRWIDEVLSIALQREPIPLSDSATDDPASVTKTATPSQISDTTH